MKLENVSDPLQSFGIRLFDRIKELAGAQPVYMKCQLYRAPPTGKVCLYIYIAGPKGRGHHANAAHLSTVWDDEFAKHPWIEKGNNWFGTPSADFYARPDDPKAQERIDIFIRHAFRAVAVSIYSKEAKDDNDRREFDENVSAITNNSANARASATWINQKLAVLTAATGIAIREILVNVASEVVKSTLLGR